MPIIPVTHVGEIRVTTVQEQPRQKLARPLSQPINLSKVAHICHSSYARGINRRSLGQAQAKKEDPI
jgi:hypothetical protein